jgi:glutathione S-transferase
MPSLVIANKLYSSWSMRPWLLMRELNLDFDEIFIPLDQPDTRERILAYSPAGKVPILVDGEVRVWESLAIMDHLADLHPGKGIWPEDLAARAMARSISAEMHAGFAALRSACPVNLGKTYAERDRGEPVARDVARIAAIWREARERFGGDGPFLFGAYGAADAMYAPVVTRLDTYSITVDPVSRAYMDAILATRSFRDWREDALQEEWVVAHDEIDEEPIAVHRRA